MLITHLQLFIANAEDERVCNFHVPVSEQLQRGCGLGTERVPDIASDKNYLGGKSLSCVCVYLTELITMLYPEYKGKDPYLNTHKMLTFNPYHSCELYVLLNFRTYELFLFVPHLWGRKEEPATVNCQSRNARRMHTQKPP